ncbi:Panacea domain-containing protein [Gloeothece verrucosa]|uniref:Putative phage-associated protein n=1 Tax=Gloeothece verrucosa (strain PCC 7822) TaxID=497965 RepID=E0UF10_GLOV7|nr:type II toxin-antitoxin system antitoxin SocA domain-containing protein [Gloeothece verrucosa]ADN14262.1 putative phage-associated protein [Gloeothece verrucosa PCC 7822]
MPSCYKIAQFFIRYAHEAGSLLTNLKLQKLVYYAQAWHLAIHGSPLFEEDFEAWVHGPVIPELYQKYKQYKWNPISEDVDKPVLSEELEEFLEEVIDVYFSYDAYELERMTHCEAPWIEARGAIPIDEPSNAIITKESMKTYYATRAELEEEVKN